eukprot:13295399-Alexandrium_andersonii.AAC.1
MEGSPEGNWELQNLAREAVQKLNSLEDMLVGDAAIADMVDFRVPEEPEGSGRPELSDGPGVQVQGAQFRGDITGAALPPPSPGRS